MNKQYFTSINSLNRVKDRNYSFGNTSKVIVTQRNPNIPSDASETELKDLLIKNAVIYLHANDIRTLPKLREEVIFKGNSLNWEFRLFTNSTTAQDVPGFVCKSVFGWNDIERIFPDFPPAKGEFSNLVGLFILCQGYLAVHDGEYLNDWDSLKDTNFKTISSSRREFSESVEKYWMAIKQSTAIEEDMNELGIKIRLVASIRGQSGTPLAEVSDPFLVKEAYDELCRPDILRRLL